MSARFFDQEVNSRLTNRRNLSAFLDSLVTERKRRVSRIQLTYIFCNDSILHNINLQFLNHDDYTDIITFDLSDKASSLVGEIYISVDRVSENAKTFQTDYYTELHRVIFHGALHLCGLRDKTPAEQTEMRQAEDEALNKWSATCERINEA